MASASLIDHFNLFSQQPSSDSNSDAKITWLRSQIVGSDIEFDSPFGSRKITYCDYTASGRFLHIIEDYLRVHVLPYYGEISKYKCIFLESWDVDLVIKINSFILIISLLVLVLCENFSNRN